MRAAAVAHPRHSTPGNTAQAVEWIAQVYPFLDCLRQIVVINRLTIAIQEMLVVRLGSSGSSFSKVLLLERKNAKGPVRDHPISVFPNPPDEYTPFFRFTMKLLEFTSVLITHHQGFS